MVLLIKLLIKFLIIEQLAQLVERTLDVGKVTGSIPVLLNQFAYECNI